MLDKVSTLGVYPAESTGEDAAKYAKKDILGKDDFLKILITELTHQDPLDPLKDRDMIAQMAQLSQLEQITQFTHSVDKFFAGFEKMMDTYRVLQASSLVGKEVKAEGVPYMEVEDGVEKLVSFKLENDADVIAEVYDSDGKLVFQERLGPQKSGIHLYRPSSHLDDGRYVVEFQAVDGEGNSVGVSVFGWEKVSEVTSENGEVKLILTDGQEKPLESVIAFR